MAKRNRYQLVSDSRYAKRPERLSKFVELAKDYNDNPQSYVREHLLTLQGKRRRIVTYRSDENGGRLRNLHHVMKAVIAKRYTSSSNSFAYKKGIGILDCVTSHLGSSCFFKTDIHAYFDNVNLEHVTSALMRSPVIRKHKELIEMLLPACFYQNRLPIGFVSSPVISDLVLARIDRKISKIDGLIYTRYADDFLLSVKDSSNQHLLEQGEDLLVGALEELGLSLNHKKTYFRELKISGDAIHVLGVNLVKQDGMVNRITVSNSYLRQVSLQAGELKAQRDTLSNEEAQEMFHRLAGQISFIRHVSQESLNKLAKLFEIKLGYAQTLELPALRDYFAVYPSESEDVLQ